MMRRRRQTKKTIKPEEIVAMKVATFIKTEYPDQPFRFDQIDQVGVNNGGKNRNLHGNKWSKGYPDLFIPKCTKRYGGLYLELKATATVHDTEHTRNQEAYHKILRKLGYKVSFCCGAEECIKKIKKYLK